MDNLQDAYLNVYKDIEEVDEAFKEPDLAKMKKQEDRHRTAAVKQRGGSRGSSKNRAFKMSSIRGALERGEDPRADGYGGKRAERGNPPEDHRAAFSKNPLNNPPRPVKKPGVNESVVEYLFVEGYADTIEKAEVMAENISENWAIEILEAAKDQTDKQIDKGVKTTYKAGNVLDNQHQGRSSGLNRLSSSERDAKSERMRGRIKARRDDLFGERNKRDDAKKEALKKMLGL